MLSPKYCHAAVGYLEEEAVCTYTHLIEVRGGAEGGRNAPTRT